MEESDSREIWLLNSSVRNTRIGHFDAAGCRFPRHREALGWPWGRSVLAPGGVSLPGSDGVVLSLRSARANKTRKLS